MDKVNIFVLALNDANLKELEAIPDADRYAFHPVLNVTELQEGEIPIEELLDRARARLDAFSGSVDAIAGYWDFPVSSMVPIWLRSAGCRRRRCGRSRPASISTGAAWSSGR